MSQMYKGQLAKLKKLSNIAKFSSKTFKMPAMKKSVGTKLFLIIFSSIVVFVLTVGLISYQISRSVIEKKVSQSNQEAIVQTAARVDLLLRGYDELSLEMLVNSKLKAALASIAKDSDSEESYAIASEVKKDLRAQLFANKTLSGIYLLPLKEKLPILSTSVKTMDIHSLRQQAWFTAAQEADGKSIWLDTEKSGIISSAVSSFGLARLFKDPDSGLADYMLVLEVKLDTINNELSSAKLGDTGGVFIVNDSGVVVQSKNQEALGNVSDVQLPVNPDTGKWPDSTTANMRSSGGLEMMVSVQRLHINHWTLVGSVPLQELLKESDFIFNLTLLMALLAAFIATMISYFVVRMIARPLVQIRNSMNEAENGNLSVRASIRSEDEMGQLGQSFNTMMERISVLVSQSQLSAQQVLDTVAVLTNASQETASFSKDISRSTQEIADGAISLAAEAEKGSDLASDIDKQMKIVINANEQMAASAEGVKRVSEQGTSCMGNLMEQTTATEMMTLSLVDKVKNLKVSAKSIHQVLEMLNSIAKQTNILALNAAIESARSGAAGKGFMVIADEIRMLANKSKESIEIVARTTTAIQNGIDETETVLSAAYPLYQEQIQSVQTVNAMFASVHGQMENLVGRLDAVTNSVHNLDQIQHTLSDAMSNVTAVAQESSATSEEVSSLSIEQLHISDSLVRLSENLEAVSAQLNQALIKFKL